MGFSDAVAVVRLDEAAAVYEDNQLDTVTGPSWPAFAKVSLDRCLRDEESSCAFVIRRTLGHQVEHSLLPRSTGCPDTFATPGSQVSDCPPISRTVGTP